MTQFHPYRLNFEADPDGGFVVTCPDVPELITQGESRDEAIESARDALVTTLQGYIKQRRAFPIPAKNPGKADTVITLPELVQAKVLLYNAMIEEGISNSELGRRMGKKSETQIRRMIDPRTNVNFPDLAQAIKTLHMRLFIGTERMA